MAQGVFSLLEVRAEQVKNIANGNFLSWPENINYGYHFSDTPTANDISKIDYSNDSIYAVSSSLPVSRGILGGAVAPTNYIYFGGGQADAVNTVQRFDVSLETVSLPGTNLPALTTQNAAVASDNYGYFAGGSAPKENDANLSLIQRIDFSTESTSSAGNLPSSTGRANFSGVSNNSYGYFGGGNIPPGSITYTNLITRIDFSSGTISNPGNNLPAATGSTFSTQSDNYGYFGAGRQSETPASVSSIRRIDFATEVVGNLGSVFQDIKGENNTSSSSNTFGYYLTSVGAQFEKLNFATETTSSLGSVAPTSDFGGNTSNISSGRKKPIIKTRTSGYIWGAIFPADSQIRKFNFSTETVSALPITTTDHKELSAQTSSNFCGYIAGGFPNTTSAITRLDFASDSFASKFLYLPLIRQEFTSVSDSSYGYFGGGRVSPSNPNITCVITRLDFSSETISSPNKNLPSQLNFLVGASSNSYGYFTGGQGINGGDDARSTIIRLDFSNETVTLSTNLPNYRFQHAASSSKFYGYFACGSESSSGSSSVYSSLITRLDFSNETVNNITNSPILRADFGALDSDSYGYFVGGGGASPLTSTATRLNFATETISSFNLPFQSTRLSALTNSN